MKRWLYIALLSIVAFSCKPEEIGPQQVNPGPEPVLKGRQVFVINEGNFGRGNAGISAYNPQCNEVQHDIYRSFNDDLPLGDVAQDLEQHKGRYYIVVNNSGKVVAVDTTTWQSVGEIDGLATPRYISFYENRAFVTSLFSHKLAVLNLDQLKVEKEISMPGTSYHIEQWQDKFWVGSKDKLVKVDPLSLTVDSIYQLQTGVERMRIAEDQLWVLCTGNSGNEARLFSISKNGDVDTEWTFGPNEEPRFLSVDAKGENLIFVMDKAIYRLPVHSNVLNPIEITDFNGQTIYGFDVDPLSGDLYVADALDYDQASDIYRYDQQGKLLHQFKAGLLTNGFHFE